MGNFRNFAKPLETLETLETLGNAGNFRKLLGLWKLCDFFGTCWETLGTLETLRNFGNFRNFWKLWELRQRQRFFWTCFWGATQESGRPGRNQARPGRLEEPGQEGSRNPAMFLGCGEPGQEGSRNPAGEGSPRNRGGAETGKQSLMLWNQ